MKRVEEEVEARWRLRRVVSVESVLGTETKRNSEDMVSCGGEGLWILGRGDGGRTRENGLEWIIRGLRGIRSCRGLWGG